MPKIREIIQEIKGKKEWNGVLNPLRQRKMLDNTHQLTGTDRNGDRIYVLGNLRDMKLKRERYRQHGGTNLVIAERMLVDERCGLTAKELY